jgi:diaphanous 1
MEEPGAQTHPTPSTSVPPPSRSVSRASSQDLISAPPPSSWQNSVGTSGRLTVGRGDLDQAIRSLRGGQRRARPRPLSKIFMDGGRPLSRVLDS